MWRSFFLAAGVTVFLIGVECLGVERFVLKASDESRIGITQPASKTVLTPAEWTPWSLMSTGVVVCIYCFTVPKAAQS